MSLSCRSHQSEPPAFTATPNFANPSYSPTSPQEPAGSFHARSSAKIAASEPPRKILGTLPPNFQPAITRAAAISKQGAGHPTTSTNRPDRAPGDFAWGTAYETKSYHAAFGDQRGRGGDRNGASREMWSAQQQTYGPERDPFVLPQRSGGGYGGADWASREPGLSYGGPRGMTSLDSRRPLQVTLMTPAPAGAPARRGTRRTTSRPAKWTMSRGTTCPRPLEGQRECCGAVGRRLTRAGATSKVPGRSGGGVTWVVTWCAGQSDAPTWRDARGR